tara:strand:+ start:79 stop:381 length:303 start_codon:yes stop_codon:yes gene_type:complete
MEKETFLLFIKDDNESMMFPASNFLGVDADSDTTTLQVSFLKETGGNNSAIVTLGFTGAVKDACRALAGTLAGQNRGLITVADKRAGTYLAPFNDLDSIA